MASTSNLDDVHPVRKGDIIGCTHQANDKVGISAMFVKPFQVDNEGLGCSHFEWLPLRLSNGPAHLRRRVSAQAVANRTRDART